MYLIIRYSVLLFSVFFSTTTTEKTYLLKDTTNSFLTFRRYLDFPKGSTFIATGSLIKRLLFTQEGGYYAVLGEMDVPFTLPSYTATATDKSRFLRLHRREINTNIKQLLTQFGLNAEMCLESIFCEMDQYKFPNNMQFTKHLLKAIAAYFEEHGLRKTDQLSCDLAVDRCGIFLLPIIINDILNKKHDN